MSLDPCINCGEKVNNPCVDQYSYLTCTLYGSQKARGKLPEQIAELRSHNAAIMTTNWPKTEGTKDDEGKEPLDLLAPEWLFGTAQVLKFGAAKYEAYNWAKGMKWSRVFGALMRHMWKWWLGEKTDPETGLSHLWHASCCLMFLTAYETRGTGTDDRYTG